MKTIEKSPDGVYRWVYEFNMLKNPMILLTVWKIFALILAGMWAFFGLLNLRDMSFAEAFFGEAKALALPAAILLVLSLLAYAILAGIYGWKYCVLFEMDEEGVRHIQMEKQFKKAQAVGWLTAAAGLAAGKPGTAGAGLLSAAKNESATKFSAVRKMKVFPAMHTIKLDSPLNHNQIYAEGEDFDFVLEYISRRVPTK